MPGIPHEFEKVLKNRWFTLPLCKINVKKIINQRRCLLKNSFNRV